jgi:hypothetical protein
VQFGEKETGLCGHAGGVHVHATVGAALLSASWTRRRVVAVDLGAQRQVLAGCMGRARPSSARLKRWAAERALPALLASRAGREAREACGPRARAAAQERGRLGEQEWAVGAGWVEGARGMGCGWELGRREDWEGLFSLFYFLSFLLLFSIFYFMLFLFEFNFNTNLRTT